MHNWADKSLFEHIFPLVHLTAKGQLEQPVAASAFSFASHKNYGGLTAGP